MVALAFESAAEYFDQALRHAEPVDHCRRGRLLLALGRAQVRCGHVAAARTAFQSAASLACTLENPELLIQAALEIGLQFSSALVDDLEVQLLEQALAVLPTADSRERARVLGRLAPALRFSPNADQRHALSQAAVSMARRMDDASTLAHVLLDAHISDSEAMTPEARVATTTEAMALAQRAGDELLALQGRALRLGDYMELGDIRTFRIETEAYARQVDQLRQARFRWQIPLLKATLASFEGQFVEAEQLVAQGMVLGQQAEQEAVLAAGPAVLSSLRFMQGRTRELEPLVREHLAQAVPLPAWRAVLAYVLCEAGREAEARIDFDLLAADGFGRIPRDSMRLSTLALLSLTCAGLRDVQRAELLYERVRPFERYVARPTRFGAGCLGAMAHCSGLLAATLGRWDAAAEHFETAIQVHAGLRAKALLANSRFHLARVLRARGRRDDARSAEEELAQAEAIARVPGIDFHLRDV
jgi:hypothetical protein